MRVACINVTVGVSFKTHLLFSSTNGPNVELLSLPFSKRRVPLQAAKFYETKRRVCQ